MTLLFKDFRFIVEALRLQIKTNKKQLETVVDENEAADLGNNTKYLKLLCSDLSEHLTKVTTPITPQ
jgi:hypothetical protein